MGNNTLVVVVGIHLRKLKIDVFYTHVEGIEQTSMRYPKVFPKDSEEIETYIKQLEFQISMGIVADVMDLSATDITPSYKP